MKNIPTTKVVVEANTYKKLIVRFSNNPIEKTTNRLMGFKG